MYDFILQAILFGGIAVMALLAARALPRVVPEDSRVSVWSHIDAWFGRLPLHRLDDRANAFLFKFLKRTRVVVMKIDNRIIRHLDKVKSHSEDRSAGHAHVQEMLDHVQGSGEEKTPE